MSPISARDLALEIAERVNTLGPVTVSRFFAGAALVANGIQFGFVMKGVLYLRVDNESRAAFETLGAAPFAYAGRSKNVTVASYYEAPSEVVDDPDELGRWAAEAYRAALTARRGSRPARRRRLSSGEFAP